MQARLLAAVRALPEKERQVVALFYVGYTQSDIVEFLQLPLSTVTKRLHTARRRLKGSAALEMFKDDLRKRRPSRDESFADKVNAWLRPFTEKDWESLSAVTSAARSGDAEGEELWLRNRQRFNETDYVRRHYVAEHEETGQLLVYGAIEQTVYLPRYRLILVVEPRWVRRGVGRLLLEEAHGRPARGRRRHGHL